MSDETTDRVETTACIGCGKEVPNDDEHCGDWYDAGDDGGMCPECQGTKRDYRTKWTVTEVEELLKPQETTDRVEVLTAEAEALWRKKLAQEYRAAAFDFYPSAWRRNVAAFIASLDAERERAEKAEAALVIAEEFPPNLESLVSDRNHWRDLYRQARAEADIRRHAKGESVLATRELADAKLEIERLNALNEDKFRHLEAYCRAASQDKAERDSARAELSQKSAEVERLRAVLQEIADFGDSEKRNSPGRHWRKSSFQVAREALADPTDRPDETPTEPEQRCEYCGVPVRRNRGLWVDKDSFCECPGGRLHRGKRLSPTNLPLDPSQSPEFPETRETPES